MSLIDQIDTDLITALKGHQAKTVATLRLLKNAITNAQIEQGKALDEAAVITVIKKQAKDRHETIELYTKAGKIEAAAAEQAELDILKKYLPEELPDTEIMPVIDQAIAEIKPQGPADFGKVMGKVMAKLRGNADGSRLAELIKNKLSQ